MSGYTDIKPKRFKKFLKWLNNNPQIEVKEGGRHLKVCCIHNGCAFTIPVSHNVVNKHIVKDFKKFLVANGLCTEKEFDSRI